MAMDKTLLSGNTTMLILKLIENQDMYGYQMIEELARQSNDIFKLKAGTLYPLLHGLEQKGLVTSYDKAADSKRARKYYGITKKGRGLLSEKEKEWFDYTKAINNILQGGASLAFR